MMGWILWLTCVAPLLVVFFIAGWIWCVANDGFVLARYTYELLRKKA
jgi:hypothetical protein